MGTVIILKGRLFMFSLAPIFTDHLLLQRNKNIAIFGNGTPGEQITVSIPERNLSAICTVAINGKWRVTLPSTGAGMNCTLTASSTENHYVFSDIAFGEVWLAGGQSNMEFMLQNEKYGQAELEKCEESNVRYFQVPRNTFQDEAYEADLEKACWELPSKETAGTWSAAAYLAAKELAEQLGVTVGIIGCNFGGSSVSCWLPESDLEDISAGHAYLEDYQRETEGKTDEEMIAEYDEYLVYYEQWSKKMEKCYREDGNMSWDEIIRRCGENKWPGPMGIKSPYRPSGMYHAMLQPILPFTLAGVFYYQGENDDHRPDTYETLLRQLVLRWRTDFENDNLPIVLVQLPMFAYADTPENASWSKIRLAQYRVFHFMREMGLVVALDQGEFGNIHPINKHAIGHRLALQAAYLSYGLSAESAFGPLMQSFTPEAHGVKVFFSNAKDGLEFHGEPELFELAGSDGIYYSAQAEIDGNAVYLTSTEVVNPTAARYAWRNYGAVTLYGKNGIPVAPFIIHW